MRHAELCQHIAKVPRGWLIAGAAGFIGSKLLHTLPALDQRIAALDNFATEHRPTLEEIQRGAPATQWTRFHSFDNDICNPGNCSEAGGGCPVSGRC